MTRGDREQKPQLGTPFAPVRCSETGVKGTHDPLLKPTESQGSSSRPSLAAHRHSTHRRDSDHAGREGSGEPSFEILNSGATRPLPVRRPRPVPAGRKHPGQTGVWEPLQGLRDRTVIGAGLGTRERRSSRPRGSTRSKESPGWFPGASSRSRLAGSLARLRGCPSLGRILAVLTSHLGKSTVFRTGVRNGSLSDASVHQPSLEESRSYDGVLSYAGPVVGTLQRRTLHEDATPVPVGRRETHGDRLHRSGPISLVPAKA
jgi:hypothetical protein